MKKQKNGKRMLIMACLCACIPMGKVMAQTLKETPQAKDTLQKQEMIKASEYIIPQRRGAEKFESKKGTEHLFFSVGAGMEHLLNMGSGRSADGPRAALYVGNWFTPVIGIRGGLDYSMWKENVSTHRIGISADYLINVSAFAARYNPRRVFEVIGVMGASYQAHIAKGGKAVHSYGLHGGVQGKFNVSPAFNLFIEPQFALYPDRIDGRYSWRQYDLIGSVMVGITYKPAGFGKSKLLQHGFASIAAGMGNTGDIAFNTEFALGKWFEKPGINGVRLSAGSSMAFLENEDGKGKRNCNVNLSVDYLCNLTTLFADRKDRIFDLIFVSGIGSYFPGGNSGSPVVINGRFGFQGQARLSRHMGLWMEPRINIFKDKSYRSDLQEPIRGTIGIMIGTCYKF